MSDEEILNELHELVDDIKGVETTEKYIRLESGKLILIPIRTDE